MAEEICVICNLPIGPDPVAHKKTHRKLRVAKAPPLPSGPVSALPAVSEPRLVVNRNVPGEPKMITLTDAEPDPTSFMDLSTYLAAVRARKAAYQREWRARAKLKKGGES